jgi:hypothetical protein
LIAGGTFTYAGPYVVNNIARLTPAGWRALEFGFSGGVFALTIRNDSLIAGGDFRRSGRRQVRGVALWRGTSWSEVGGGVDGAVYAFERFQDELVAAGRFTRAGSTSAASIARWNGAAWSPLGSLSGGQAPGDRVRALAVYRGDLIVKGPHARGQHTATWDRRDAGGASVARGVYVLRLRAGATVVTRKLAVVHE